MRFKDFLLTEDKNVLGRSIGDILSSIHDLMLDNKGMGSRQTIDSIQVIVSHIRRILHSNWTKEDEKYLVELQKVGVYLMKGIDDKIELSELIKNASDSIEKIMGKIGVPQNNLASPETSEEPQDQSLAPSQGKNISSPPSNLDNSVIQSTQQTP